MSERFSFLGCNLLYPKYLKARAVPMDRIHRFVGFSKDFEHYATKYVKTLDRIMGFNTHRMGYLARATGLRVHDGCRIGRGDR